MGPDSIPILDLIVAFLLVSMITVTYSVSYELPTKYATFQKYYEQVTFRIHFLNMNTNYCRNVYNMSFLNVYHSLKIINNTDEKYVKIILNYNDAYSESPILFLSCGDINVKIYKNK